MTEAAPKKKLGGLEKVLIGCAVGCGVLIVGALVAGGLGFFWVYSPGEQIATDRIVGDGVAGVVKLSEVADDPGVQALLTKVLRTVNEVNRRQQEDTLPESMRWLARLQRQPSGRDLRNLIPKEATIVFEPAAAGEDAPFVVAVNPRAMVRAFKAMLDLASRADENEEIRAEHRGHRIYLMGKNDDDGALAFVAGTVLFSNSRAALERAIDRIEDGPATAADVGQRLGRDLPEGDWDAVGVLGNQGGLVSDLLGDREALEAPAGDELRFGIDVVSADEIRLTAVAAGSPDLRPLVEERLAEIERQAAEWGIAVESQVVDRGGELVTELRFTGIEAAIDRTVQIDDGRRAGSEEP